MCMDTSKEDWQTWDTLHYENGSWTNKFFVRKFIVSLEHLPFTILTFYLLDVLCPLQENITVYKVPSKNFELDFDSPKCNWINQVLGF